MLRLWLLAHAATASQRQYRFPFDEEPIEPITSEQRDRVRAAIGRCDAVWAAPERRSRMTAATLDLEPPPTTTAEQLKAWSVGDWTGQSLQSLLEDDARAFHTWQTDPGFAPPHGEPLAGLLARTAAWAESLTVGGQTQTQTRGLVIADPAVIRALVVHALAAGPAAFWRFDVGPLASALVQHAGGQWRLRQLG